MTFTGLMPAVEPNAPLFGLASVATVIKHSADDNTWVAGFEQENSICGISGWTWIWCGDGAVAELTGDEGESGDRWEKVYPFMVQAKDNCGSALVARRPEVQKNLVDMLDLLSVKGAERELWTGETNPDAKALTRDANMVGSGLSVMGALAAVEDALAACLPGVQGIIHMTPGIASLIGGNLNNDNEKDVLCTRAGTPVLVGRGYAVDPQYLDSPAIYGTGPVTAHLGPAAMVTDDLAQMADVKHNEFMLVAERPVAVTWDGCCHVGATITVT